MSKIKIGDIIETKRGGYATIISYTNFKNVTVKFNDIYGYVTTTSATSVRKGTIRNPYYPNFMGEGFIGSGKYLSTIDGSLCRPFIMWKAMINRCYNEKMHVIRPTYKDCSVCDEWLNYQNFAKWYDDYIYHGDGFELDKDLLISGNRIYSPEYCVLVPPEINLVFYNGVKNGLPVGVREKNGNYCANISIDGRFKYLGYYPTIRQASDAYNEAKQQNIRRLAYKYMGKIEPILFESMLNWKPDE